MKIKIKKKLKEVATAMGMQTYAGDRSGAGASVLSQTPSGGEEITRADLEGGPEGQLISAVAAYLKKLPNVELAEAVSNLMLSQKGSEELDPYLEKIDSLMNALPGKV